MKKIIIIFSLIFSILINNITPVYCMDYAIRIDYFYITVSKTQYNNPEFYLNSEDGLSLEIVDCTNNITLYKNFRDMGSAEGKYYFRFYSGEKFYYSSDGSEEFDYDIYILNSSGERIYHLFINNAKGYMYDFDMFSLYTEEDNGGTESPGDSESPDNSGSGNDGSVTTLDVSLLHTDLLILIVIIGFFEFMKMINIIVRNYGGDK